MKLVKWMAVAALLTAGFSGGCSTYQGSEMISEQPTDNDVVMDVLDRLSSDGVTKNYNISVTSESGVVTLAGFVRDQNARFRAVSIARGTSGVKDVVDKLSNY